MPQTFSGNIHQAAAAPRRAANRKPWAFSDVPPLDGALVVDAEPVDPALPNGEVEPEVGVELPVLPVLVEVPLEVDMVVLVEALVVLEVPALVVALVVISVLATVAELAAAVALVMAAELGDEDIDSTVFVDSTTKGAE